MAPPFWYGSLGVSHKHLSSKNALICPSQSGYGRFSSVNTWSQHLLLDEQWGKGHAGTKGPLPTIKIISYPILNIWFIVINHLSKEPEAMSISMKRRQGANVICKGRGMPTKDEWVSLVRDQEQTNQRGSVIYKTFQKACMDRVRPVIMAPGRWRQDQQEFKVSLSYEWVQG